VGTFRFKKFSVNDDGAAMKVGTDAVLLGAWCPVREARWLLDIGTGSGVIALMLAQRSRENSLIDAVELNKRDAEQALANVKKSPWARKVNVINEAIQSYQTDRRYDLIVCNPPFFTTSLLPPDQRRSEARHDTRLTTDEIIDAVSRLLGPAGTFSLILPVSESKSFQAKALRSGIHINRLTQFHSRASNPPERVLMAFSRTWNKEPSHDQLILYSSGNIKTPGYQQSTADFYL